MSSQKNPDVKKVKGKVERFHWENYRRNYESDQSELEKLYWHCVLSDIIDFNKGGHEGPENKQRIELAIRLYRSYLGCFYKAGLLYHSILDKFDNLSAFYRNEQDKIWQTWKEQQKKKRDEHFTLICHSVKRNFEHREAIKPDQEQTPYNIRAYDEWHDIIAQKPSPELIEHLRHGTLAKRQPDTTNAVFPYHIKGYFIEVLEGYAREYFKAFMTYTLLTRIDRQFEDGKTSIETKKKLDKDEPIKVAINDMFHKHPELQHLGHSQIAYLVRLKYKDSDGNDLKHDSVKKAVERMDS